LARAPEPPPVPTDAVRYPALDSVRGLAALTVLVNHCLSLFPLFGGASAGDTVPYPGAAVLGLLRSPVALLWDGRGAVAIFFVLSGFVLALPWFRGTELPWPSFVLRRFCRIYLPYAAAVGLAMALTASLPAAPAVTAWFDANWTEPVSITAVLDHVLMLGAHNTFDNAVWSLNHEMRISLFFPLLMLPLLRFGLAGGAVSAVVLYLTAGAITHVFGWHGALAEVAATIRYSTFFILGAALARSAGRLHAGQPGPAATVALLTGLCCLWLSREPAVMAAGSALIILAAIRPGRIQRTLNRPGLRTLGRISYSLYLVHLLVLLSAAHLLIGILPLPAIVAGAFLASLLAAALFHRLVEAPSDRLGRRLSVRRVPAARPAGAAPPAG